MGDRGPKEKLKKQQQKQREEAQRKADLQKRQEQNKHTPDGTQQQPDYRKAG